MDLTLTRRLRVLLHIFASLYPKINGHWDMHALINNKQMR